MSKVDAPDSAGPSHVGESAEPPMESAGEAPEGDSWVARHRWQLHLAAWVVAVLSIVIGIPRYVVQLGVVEAFSMIPALEPGDRVVIDKLSPRFGSIGRGSLVVVANPEAPATSTADAAGPISVSAAKAANSDAFVLKRVIAVAGDTIEVRDRQLLVNGRPVDEPYLAGDMVTRDFGPIGIPSDHFFIMGDNRNATRDSRHYGPVASGEVLGRIIFRVWPPSRVGSP